MTRSHSNYALVVCLGLTSPVAIGANFLPLGDIPGSSGGSAAAAISADGSVVVGTGFNALGESEAFRWTAGGGIVGLGSIPGRSNSLALGVSGDGSVVVGTGFNALGEYEAFHWTAGTGMVGLGDLPGGPFDSWAFGVSADGSVVTGIGQIVGATPVDGATGPEAFRWSSEGGMVGLGAPPGGSFSLGFGVSGDGRAVVGVGHTFVGLTLFEEAFRWTADGGMVGLGDLTGGSVFSDARGASADGSVVVGFSGSTSGLEAFRWTADGGMVGLGDLPGGSFSSRALGISADGSVAVGRGNSDSGDEAFVWTEANGMERLLDVLLANGATVPTGWTLRETRGISADGQWVVGWSSNSLGTPEAFLANIAASPVPIPGAAWLIAPAFGLLAPWVKRKATPDLSQLLLPTSG